MLGAFALGVVALGLYFIPVWSKEWRAALLWGLFAIPSNSVIPIPHEPGLLYFASDSVPWALALTGAVGVFIAAYFDRFLVGWALGSKRGKRLQDTRSWQFTQRMLMKQPFITLAAVAFAGVPPIQAVRLVVISTGYSIHRYATAVALGRFPRFFILAYLGYTISPPDWLTLSIALLFVGWAAFLVFGSRLKKGRTQ